MKLVIDISENEYKFLQQCVKSGVGSKGDKYIANGTPIKTGTWTPEHCIDYQCRGCHSKCTWFVCSVCRAPGEKIDNFCRICGADMREEIIDGDSN